MRFRHAAVAGNARCSHPHRKARTRVQTADGLSATHSRGVVVAMTREQERERQGRHRHSHSVAAPKPVRKSHAPPSVAQHPTSMRSIRLASRYGDSAASSFASVLSVAVMAA